MNRFIHWSILADILLAACAPATPLPTSTQPVTQPPPIPAVRPTQNPALVPFYTEDIP